MAALASACTCLNTTFKMSGDLEAQEMFLSIQPVCLSLQAAAALSFAVGLEHGRRNSIFILEQCDKTGPKTGANGGRPLGK